MVYIISFVLSGIISASLNIGVIQSEINSIVNRTKDAVVSVRVVKEGRIAVIEPEFFFGLPEERIYRFQFSGIGSGVIVSEDGYVVTNDHVIRGADEIKIEINENGKKVSYSANYVGGQPKLDIAILKIRAQNKKFPYLNFSTKPINVGDIVLAIGYPFGFKQTYTMGIVSAKDISLKIEGRIYDNLIQTDAAINQGNSGGPLVDIYGNIVGINSAIYSKTGEFAGVGFAIPAWRVRQIVDEVIYGKKILRAWLGISLIPTDYLLTKYFSYSIPKGGIINKVYEGSPAQKAGLKRGDIVVSIDGGVVENDEDLILRIYYRNPGDKVEIKYIRDGEEYTTSAILALRPTDEELVKLEKKEKSKIIDTTTEYEFKGLILIYTGKSCIVKKVGSNSPFRGYLKEGDEIIKVNNRGFNSFKEMKEIFSSIKLEEGVLFDMIRDGEPMFLSITVK